MIESFADSRTRAAIRHVVRAVVDWKGQIITMTDRAYLTEHMPICVIWGSDDMVIPVRPRRDRAARRPVGAGSRSIPNAGHFPHKDHPQRFVKLLNDFIRTTRPRRTTWRRGGTPALRRRPVQPRAEAGERPVSALPSA